VHPVDRTNYLRDEDGNYAKANRKIPLWAHKPTQNNHRIIKAFFEIEEEKGSVTVEELAERCSNPVDYPVEQGFFLQKSKRRCQTRNGLPVLIDMRRIIRAVSVFGIL
jgi:hypothetical protein